jgi:hypothetical protein
MARWPATLACHNQNNPSSLGSFLLFAILIIFCGLTGSSALPGCRYRLVSPSEPYASMFTSAQVKLDLALRTARVLVDDPMAPVATVQERILSGNTAGTSNVPLKQEVLEAEAGFLALQLQALQQVCEIVYLQ